MSLCNKEISKRPYNSSVPLMELNKDYGLNIIYNVNGNINICEDIFVGPTLDTNLTTIETGLTETSIGVFNLSDFPGGDVPFEFTFTGNTDVLSGYTGDFVYEIYPRTGDDIEIPEIIDITEEVPAQPTFSRFLTYRNGIPFSELSLTNTDLIPNLVADQEWVLNYTYNFDRQNCVNKNKHFGETIKNTYDKTQSYYFVTLINPPEMVLGPFPEETPTTPEILTLERRNTGTGDETYVFGVPTKQETEENSCCLKVETLPISLPSTNIFTIDGIASPNTLIVSVNGITLSPDDYVVVDNTVLKLVEPLYPDKDIITVTYIEAQEDIDTVYSEQFEIVSGITSGVTSATTINDKVYFNTEQNKYEYYTDLATENPENILLFLNGVKLTYGVDYYLSVTVENRIIFDSINLTMGDILYFVYKSDEQMNGDYGLITYENSLEWRTEQPIMVNNRVIGEFIVEITEPTDVGFDSVDKVKLIIEYIGGETSYDVSIPTNTLESNKRYIWRVVSKKYYIGLLGNVFETTNISETGKFHTNNLINSY